MKIIWSLSFSSCSK